jgi:hypothetical protein
MMDDALVGVPIGLPAAVDCACMDLPVLPRRLCHAFVDKDVCQSNLPTENSVHSLKLGVHASRILERAEESRVAGAWRITTVLVACYLTVVYPAPTIPSRIPV